jgi:Uncharacterised nucleotidyltransferase
MTAIEAMGPGGRGRGRKAVWIADNEESPVQMVSTSPDDEARNFYRSAMQALIGADIPFLVGGAFALERYTGIKRYTKDFDIFVRSKHITQALAALEEAGYRSELTFPHWLGKAHHGNLFVDIIFGSGNGEARVDDLWFEHAVQADVLGMPVLIYPPEEAIWSKSFVMERERYDGADIAHLLRICAEKLDWQRLVMRYGSKWRLLLSYLVLFGFIYPAERNKIPAWVMRDLLGRLQGELDVAPPPEKVVQGTLISREQFLIDVDEWGYRDGRLPPSGNMSPEDIAYWTGAIGKE